MNIDYIAHGPERGGHVGFSLAGMTESWMEVRAFEFVNSFEK